MRLFTLAVLTMTTAACGHGHRSHAHGHGGGEHGNPDDLGAYIARQEDPERVAWQKPDEVIAALGLTAGMTACDIGAGPGYFSLRLARAVGERGLVYAVDVEPTILAALRERLSAAGLRNVVPVLGLGDDPLLPASTCDLVLVVNTMHHFPDPAAYLARLTRSLEPGGRIVNIDFHKRETGMGPPLEMRIDRGEFLAMAEKAGLVVAAEHELLPHQYFIELRAK